MTELFNAAGGWALVLTGIAAVFTVALFLVNQEWGYQKRLRDLEPRPQTISLWGLGKGKRKGMHPWVKWCVGAVALYVLTLNCLGKIMHPPEAPAVAERGAE